jgi:hypothetical protein
MILGAARADATVRAYYRERWGSFDMRSGEREAKKKMGELREPGAAPELRGATKIDRGGARFAVLWGITQAQKVPVYSMIRGAVPKR